MEADHYVDSVTRYFNRTGHRLFRIPGSFSARCSYVSIHNVHEFNYDSAWHVTCNGTGVSRGVVVKFTLVEGGHRFNDHA